MAKVVVSYIVFDWSLVQLLVLSLPVNGFAPNMQIKSPAHATGPSSSFGPDGVDPKACGSTNGQDTAFCYITDGPFDMVHDAIWKNVLYDLSTGWSDLNKLPVPGNNDTLQMVFCHATKFHRSWARRGATRSSWPMRDRLGEWDEAVK